MMLWEEKDYKKPGPLWPSLGGPQPRKCHFDVEVGCTREYIALYGSKDTVTFDSFVPSGSLMKT